MTALRLLRIASQLLLAALPVMIVTGCARGTVAPTATAIAEPEPPADLNRNLRITLLGLDDLPPEQGIPARLANGHNVQAVLQIPGARQPGGTLLDPESVSVQFNGTELEKYVLYKDPSVALVFAVVPHDSITTNSELQLSAKLLGEADLAAGWRLPLQIDLDALKAPRVLPPARTIRLLDVEGTPVLGARVFGQRREDLFALADESGAVRFDAPTRNSMEIHSAWAPGYWWENFDVIRDEPPTLIPDAKGRRRVKRRLTIVGPETAPIERALLLSNELYWSTWIPGTTSTLIHRRGGKNPLLVLAPGYQPKVLLQSEMPKDGVIELKPL